jgi:predicted nucleotidyltransferase
MTFAADEGRERGDQPRSGVYPVGRRVISNGLCVMDMQDDWLCGLCSWATGNDNIRELWLFGSRATGHSRSDSDVDIAIALMPAVGNTDWALGSYFALDREWKHQLEAIVGRHVSLEAIVPGTKEDAEVRHTGVLLWARDE